MGDTLWRNFVAYYRALSFKWLVELIFILGALYALFVNHVSLLDAAILFGIGAILTWRRPGVNPPVARQAGHARRANAGSQHGQRAAKLTMSLTLVHNQSQNSPKTLMTILMNITR